MFSLFQTGAKMTGLYKSILPVDDNGFYGKFGGSFVPEKLQKNMDELREAYLKCVDDPEFEKEFRDLLRDYVGRPSPLYYSRKLSERYGTNIYLKREDLNHTGAHKINNAIASALLAKRMGKKRIIAETGAGQHGVATATVCALMGLECTVYMGELDMQRQRPNVERMRMLGAKVVPAMSGTRTLNDAVNEALDAFINDPDNFYLIGSAVGPQPYPEMVARFQSVISEEIKKQLKEKTGRENPDVVIACIGGGSNAAGTFYHFINEPDVKLIGAEAAGKGIDSGETAATLTVGKEGILHGSKTLLMKDEKGEVQEAYSLSAGLDYPGIGPLHAFLAETGRMEVEAVTDDEAVKAAYLLTREEGIIPALESSHALAVLEKRKFGKDQVVVITVSGRGDKDLETYLSRQPE